MTKERRLGRGLEALLGRIAPADEAPVATAERVAVGMAEAPAARSEPYGVPFPQFDAPQVRSLTSPVADAEPAAQPAAPTRVPLALIDSNPYQPRNDFDSAEIESLAETLQAHGLLQPLVVRRVGQRYQLVAGERRLRAATHVGWTEVPVNIIEADDRQLAELAIVENLHRKDLNALEKAASFQRYLDQYGCTQDELAGRLKLDRSTIANLIRLLELPSPVRDTLRSGKITQGHARALLPLGDEREQVAFCQRIQREGLSVRQTESLVQETIHDADAEPLAVVDRDGSSKPAAKPSAHHLASLEQQFRAAIGLRVSLQQTAKGRGKLTIHFQSQEEFEHLRDYLIGTEDVKSRAG